jgi:hypothetical protein
MKTYFLAWESGARRGHAIYEFEDSVPSREALSPMLNVASASVDGETVTATQFNNVT